MNHTKLRSSGRKGCLLKWAVPVIMLLCIVWTAGCSHTVRQTSAGSGETEGDYDNLISVGFSQIGSESFWRDANTKSIQGALTRENGYFLMFSNARQKQENQIKAVRSFISQQVDYIAIAPVTQDGWETVLMEARDAGIPVILVDRRVSVEDTSLYTAWLGTDAEEEGRSAGRWLEEYLSEKGRDEDDIQIAVLTGTLGSSAQIGRSEGFAQIAARHENWHIAAEQTGDFTTAKGKEAMSDILRNYDDIDVVVSQNDDMTFGALEAIEDAGLSAGEDGIILISFDAAKQALEKVAEGVIGVDIECNPLQGPYLDELIRKIEAGEDIPKETFVEEQIFTIDNAAQAAADRMY